MLQKLRESLALILIAGLPLHALIVTWGTKMMFGPGHAPWSVLAVWKEVLLLILIIVGLLESFRCISRKQFSMFNVQCSNVDFADVLITVLIGLAVSIGIALNQSVHVFAFGFKYTLFPLCAFLVLRRVDWSEWFRKMLLRVIVGMGMIVSLFGIVSFFAPMRFFQFFGYSDLHSLYLPGGPLAAFQQIGEAGIRRVQSTMSGPNQLGLWLLLPWSMCLLEFFGTFDSPHRLIRMLLPSNGSSRNKLLYGVCTVVVGTCIFLTFSRSAWIAAGAIVLAAVWMQFSAKDAGRHLVRLCGVGAMTLFLVGVLSPNTLLRFQSSRDHIAKPMHAISMIMEQPLGYGLGAVGPASNRFRDACVHLDVDADASWAADRPDLCVFTGGVQVQPETPCLCPIVTENWYLQVGVELGVIGFTIFLLLILHLLRRLYVPNTNTDEPNDILSPEVFLPLLGIAIASMFLHAWEDAGVAYTLWLMIAVAGSSKKRLLRC